MTGLEEERIRCSLCGGKAQWIKEKVIPDSKLRVAYTFDSLKCGACGHLIRTRCTPSYGSMLDKVKLYLRYYCEIRLKLRLMRLCDRLRAVEDQR